MSYGCFEDKNSGNCERLDALSGNTPSLNAHKGYSKSSKTFGSVFFTLKIRLRPTVSGWVRSFDY